MLSRSSGDTMRAPDSAPLLPSTPGGSPFVTTRWHHCAHRQRDTSAVGAWHACARCVHDCGVPHPSPFGWLVDQTPAPLHLHSLTTPNHAFSGRMVQRWWRKTRTRDRLEVRRRHCILPPVGCKPTPATSNPASDLRFEHGLTSCSLHVLCSARLLLRCARTYLHTASTG